MSSSVINKIAASLVLVTLALVLIGMLGNALVEPGDGRGAGVAQGPVKPAAETKTETAATVAPPPAKTAAPAAPDASLQPVTALLASANEANGRKLFKKCSVCHSAGEGQKNKIGPNLWNIINARVANRPGYRYSAAMKAMNENWTFETLDAFLADPKGAVKGTKMGFSGIKRAGDRADLIAYLRSLSEFPVPLP